MKILITGSRTWRHPEIIETLLNEYLPLAPEGLVIIHGAAARGADRIASDWVEKISQNGAYKVTQERWYAKWDEHGKKAGLWRNVYMVDNSHPDLVLAFIRDYSKGATHCLEYAQVKGVPSRTFRESESGVYLGEA